MTDIRFLVTGVMMRMRRKRCISERYVFILHWFLSKYNLRMSTYFNIQGSIGTWIRCKKELLFEKVILDTRSYHANLSKKGYRSLIYRSVYSILQQILIKNNFKMDYFSHLRSNIYWENLMVIDSGDHDMVVPFQSTQAWIRGLNYSIIDDWRPWIVEGQYAGWDFVNPSLVYLIPKLILNLVL